MSCFTPWYENRQDLHDLATWMLENDVMFTALDVMDFLECPWAWEDSWRKYQNEVHNVLWAVS